MSIADEKRKKARLQVEHFGEPVTWTAGAGPAVELSGIWIEPATRETTAPGVTCLVFFANEDFSPNMPERGDVMTLRSNNYEVVTVAPDNSAGITIGLKRTI